MKLRGHRVDLGEVRHALLSHPLVEQAAVTTYAPLDGRAELAAFVVGSRLPAVREIRSHLREHLSEPMIPRHLLRVDALPLTLSGKLDRAALLAKIAREQRAPDLAGGAEAVITHVFRQVLGDARFERGDDFFAAGGNSLLALQAATGISRALGVNLELRAVYRHGTPESLALALARGDASGERVVALRPPRRSALDVFFLPPALGAAQIFAPLAHLLPEACNPWGVDYGLDGRPLEGSIPDLGAGLLGEVLGRAGGRTLVLVGYSIGAAVSFELARMLESRGRAPKLVLIDSMPGQRAGVADAAPDRAGRMAEMARSYEIRGAVACDVVALEAADKTSPLGMEGWRAHARGRFRHITIDGDHDTLLAPARLPALSVVIQRAIAFLVPAADRKFADDAKESPC